MSELRQQATDLIATMPEENLLIIVSILQVFKEISDVDDSEEIDFSKYRGCGKKMFNSTEEIDNYIRESRDDRL